MTVISEHSAVTSADGQTADSGRFVTRLLGGLVATIPALPLFAIVATVTIYVSAAGSTNNTLLYGAVVAIVAWLIVGGVAASFNSLARANPGVYSELLARVEALDADVRSASTRLDAGSTRLSMTASLSESDSYERASLTELEEHVRALARDFGRFAQPSTAASTLRDKGTTARHPRSRPPSGEWDLTGDEATEIKHPGTETIVERSETES